MSTHAIYRLNGDLIGAFPGSSMALAVEDAARGGASLRGASLRGTDLRGTDLREANLYEANLYGADLRGADLRGASLRGASLYEANLYEANLRGTDLRGTDLRGANLRGARLPSPGTVLLADWGTLAADTICALMRLDAGSHSDPAAFDRWAAGEGCPYESCVVERAANFEEDRDLWSPGPPPTLWEAMCMVLDEKCPGWRVGP